MAVVTPEILQRIIDGAAEPILLLSMSQPDWPVLLANPAFRELSGAEVVDRPFADVIEALVGRDLALDISEALRQGQETGFPVELGHNEYLLALVPMLVDGDDTAGSWAVYLRGAAGVGTEMHQALLQAKRRIRDLSRDDPATGLLNGPAFEEIVEHDWAVARREGSSLALVAFEIDDFDAYENVFGRHAADTCLRRVSQAIRKFLRRASDVVGRTENATICVLSHSSDGQSVHAFAVKIASAVRELGLHHPRSSIARFVTVSYRVRCIDGSRDGSDVRDLLADLLGRSARKSGT